jgi:putative transposase
MMAAHGAAPVGRRRAGTPKPSSSAWRRKTGIWGYLRIRGALSDLGHQLARGTIANILKRNGIEPAPERIRKTTWKEFLTQHWDLIVATDFFTVEVWTRQGLQRFVVLFFIELSTRRVQIAGISARANKLWMNQIARNLTDAEDGLLKGQALPAS